MTTLTLTRPDDCHLHLRDGPQMRSVLRDTARRFKRAIVMPNLSPPVVTVEMAVAYRARILAALPGGMSFEPLMTLYLTDNTLPAEIVKATNSGAVHGVKYYPAGATTNSAAGVTDITRCYGALSAMEEMGMPLLVHGEMTSPEVDVFDREKIFLDQVLVPLMSRFPHLRIVFEHISTREAVEFVRGASNHIAATITAHHLLLNRNALFNGGLRPHHYCLPLLKREIHRRQLVNAATSGNPKFFLGTDSAPHSRSTKETACGCAGIYTSHAAIELYAEAFDRAGSLDKLEAFASFHGADFYRLPRNTDSIKLKKESWTVPGQLEFAEDTLVPLWAGECLTWQLTD
ncbi:MAG: dihydroorotase [Nitrosospira sp.]|nr:dihydroorotase [Nitrosospira sp.]